MQVNATRKDAYNLIFEGALALSKVQSNGIRVDVKYLEDMRGHLDSLTSRELRIFEKCDEVKEWKRKFGAAYNPASDDQLGYILFDYLKFPVKKKTAKGNASLDVNVLEEYVEETQNKMLCSLMRMRKLAKAYGTYLQGIVRETNEDGYLRPFFCLHLARTYRSSSNSPNFQNFPVRDAEISKLIRTAFIPRKDRHILELDFKGIEVQMAYFYHRDPVMKSFLLDKTKDMHRDMAMRCFLLGPDEWNKKTRHAGKNKFVFPEFYGSYYEQTGTDLWKSIALNKLCVGKNNDGVSLYDHLKKHGIHNVEQFKQHIKKVEDWFWNKQFSVYTQWKKSWLNAYTDNGYFDSLTGFRYQGVLKRNEVINYAIQGSAFHCLLRTLIQTQKWLEKNKMQTLIIGQIHDSMVLDICPNEMGDVLAEVLRIIKEDLSKFYPFIDMPMVIEAELAPVNESWFCKKEISLDPYIQ